MRSTTGRVTSAWRSPSRNTIGPLSPAAAIRRRSLGSDPFPIEMGCQGSRRRRRRAFSVHGAAAARGLIAASHRRGTASRPGAAAGRRRRPELGILRAGAATPWRRNPVTHNPCNPKAPRLPRLYPEFVIKNCIAGSGPFGAARAIGAYSAGRVLAINAIEATREVVTICKCVAPSSVCGEPRNDRAPRAATIRDKRLQSKN